jgi:hypothetical protein
MHSAKSMAQRSKKPSRQAAMLEPTVPEGCGKSVDGAALIQVGTKTRNGQSLVERLFRSYLVSQRLNLNARILSAIGPFNMDL